MKRKSINRWITRCFLVILLLAMIASAAANLYEAFNTTIRSGSRLAFICSRNVRNLMAHQWGLDELDRSPENGALYNEAQRILGGLCQSYGLDNLAVYSIDPLEDTRYYYIYACPDMGKGKTTPDDLSRSVEKDIRLLPGEEELLAGSSQL